MRVLFTCGGDLDYIRNAVIRQILKQSHEVIEITDTSDRLAARHAKIALRLLTSRHDYDLAFVGFTGSYLMLLVPFLTRRPILFDMFLSMYDTYCLDRRRFAPNSLAGRLLFWLDANATRRASHILSDTHTHAQYLCETFHFPPNKITFLFTGCNEQFFYPRERKSVAQRSTITVLHYGAHLPLHGLDTVLRAAKKLESNAAIRFKIIGSGISTKILHRLADELELHNVDWVPFLHFSKLPDEIDAADICLGGHFSTIPKAARVIGGKTFECLAMAKPTIVGENPANRELLTHRLDAYFCPMADPDALAESILTLAQDAALRDYLGQNARQTFLARCSVAAMSPALNDVIAKLVS
jgi:glycosyltransferase involved in cell wall biosynthesis